MTPPGRRATIALVRAGPLTFTRRDDERVLAGVASGFARQHGVDPLVVRGALVVLTFAAGLGLVLYAVGAAVAEPPGAPVADPQQPDVRRNLAVGFVALGAMLLVRSTGVWLGDAVMVPLTVAAAGVVVLGVVRTDLRAPGALAPLADLAGGRHARTRVLVGAGLVAAGLVLVGLGDRVSGALRAGVFATALSLVGIALAIGPWIAGVAQAAAEERRRRIRSEEREVMAAHLHDSVLQTLALIQRNADDPRRTVTLARQQEHELRAWLYGVRAPSADTFAAAVRDTARDVEQRYDVRIEVVVVGDAPLDDDLRAMCAALREACVNAAKHSGSDTCSVYAEVGADDVEVFVRDRGLGFDPAATPSDRLGITQSIEGRMERAGGTAVIDSTPGDGTEVRLVLPRRAIGHHEVGT
jgi:signal transduction histidine kinase/phage shock protein PspC (stress-responsive transcriptional regulator)